MRQFDSGSGRGEDVFAAGEEHFIRSSDPAVERVVAVHAERWRGDRQFGSGLAGFGRGVDQDLHAVDGEQLLDPGSASGGLGFVPEGYITGSDVIGAHGGKLCRGERRTAIPRGE